MVDAPVALAQALQERDEARCALQGALERLETLEATRADAALHVSMLRADNRQLQLQLEELRQGGSREQGAGQLAAVESKARELAEEVAGLKELLAGERAAAAAAAKRAAAAEREARELRQAFPPQAPPATASAPGPAHASRAGSAGASTAGTTGINGSNTSTASAGGSGPGSGPGLSPELHQQWRQQLQQASAREAALRAELADARRQLQTRSQAQTQLGQRAQQVQQLQQVVADLERRLAAEVSARQEALRKERAAAAAEQAVRSEVEYSWKRKVGELQRQVSQLTQQQQQAAAAGRGGTAAAGGAAAPAPDAGRWGSFSSMGSCSGGGLGARGGGPLGARAASESGSAHGPQTPPTPPARGPSVSPLGQQAQAQGDRGPGEGQHGKGAGSGGGSCGSGSGVREDGVAVASLQRQVSELQRQLQAAAARQVSTAQQAKVAEKELRVAREQLQQQRSRSEADGTAARLKAVERELSDLKSQHAKSEAGWRREVDGLRRRLQSAGPAHAQDSIAVSVTEVRDGLRAELDKVEDVRALSRRYWELAAAWHPDKHAQLPFLQELANRVTQLLNEARDARLRCLSGT